MARFGIRHSWSVVIGLTLILSGCFEGNRPADKLSPDAPPSTTAPTSTSNQPPTISGKTTSAVKAGEQFVFQPTANDPDGDPLTFSVSNKPAWLSFSAITGRLSGVPGDGDVATYSGITITVSDGNSTAGLSPFSVAVTQIALGSVTLSWIPPAENTDGSQLTNLAGYRIYFGKTQSGLDQMIKINSAGVTSYVIENLSPATYFFAMSSVNSAGVESELSGTLSKKIS